jgi:small subunit ribosomal protein S16
MLRIRLARVGAKRQPSYRIVVANVESKRDGRVVERIGFYNPRTDPITYNIDEGRALHWLSVGALPSDAVERLLTKQGTIDRLGRLHKGEKLDALVAEFEGKPAPVPVAEAATTAAETVKGTVAKLVGGAVEAVGEALAAAGEVIAGHPAEEATTEEATTEEAATEETPAEEAPAEEAPAETAEETESAEPVSEVATSGEEA